MEKVLVTGGAGYIGSILVPVLLGNEFCEVVVVDNFMYSQTPLLDYVYDSRLQIIRGDVRDKQLMKKLLGGVDWIIPLAAIVGQVSCEKDPLRTISTNFDAIKLLLDLRSKDQRIIFPNTNSGYGAGQGSVICDELSPLAPISLYGKTKVEAEEAVMASENAVTFRLATVFGMSPRMRMDLLVNEFVYRAATDGFVVLYEANFKRNYIHIRDVVRAFVFAMDNFDKMKNEVYNLGLSDANLSKSELCAEIKKQIPKFTYLEAPVGSDPDQRNYIVSNAKIEAAGFKPAFSLQDGIAELIKGYQVIRRNQFSNV